MKLELGSGDRPTPGFVHLDIREDVPDVDIVCDAFDINHVAVVDLGPLEEIRATHLLEHFSHRQTVAILAHWLTFLAPGGLIYLEVPNLTGHVNAWKWGSSSDEQFVEYMFGEQDHPGNYHKTMFTARTLSGSLERAGFERIEITDIGLVLVAQARRPSA